MQHLLQSNWCDHLLSSHLQLIGLQGFPDDFNWCSGFKSQGASCSRQHRASVCKPPGATVEIVCKTKLLLFTLNMLLGRSLGLVPLIAERLRFCFCLLKCLSCSCSLCWICLLLFSSTSGVPLVKGEFLSCLKWLHNIG